jgi:hypothetical protein
VEVPGDLDSPALSLPNYAYVVYHAAVDLASPEPIEFDCVLCGCRIGLFRVEDGDAFYIHELERQTVSLGPVNNPVRIDPRRGTARGKLTGRHRLKIVADRGSDIRQTGKLAYAFECGCHHRRTISQGALRRKLTQASERRISL